LLCENTGALSDVDTPNLNEGGQTVADNKSFFKKSDRSLRDMPLLTEAPPAKIKELEKSCKWIEFGADEIVVDIKDESTNVFFVVKGKLKAMDFLSEDEEVSLAELEPGDSFGELSAIDLKTRSARVTTVEPSLLASLSSKDFRKTLMDCPGIGLALLKTFAGFIRVLNTRITALSTMSPHQRIYLELLRISEPDTQSDGTNRRRSHRHSGPRRGNRTQAQEPSYQGPGPASETGQPISGVPDASPPFRLLRQNFACRQEHPKKPFATLRFNAARRVKRRII
jgi:CRP-like cAMP-binding protein